MKTTLLFLLMAALISLAATSGQAGETGMSFDGTNDPNAPAPHIAPPGGGNTPKPLTTNTTPVTGVAPLSGDTPQHEVQPGEETPQVEEAKPVAGGFRPPRNTVTKDGGHGGSDPGGSGGGGSGGSGGGSGGSGGSGNSGDSGGSPDTWDNKSEFDLLDELSVERSTVRGVDTPLSTNQGPESGPGDPQSGQAAPPRNPLKNQMKGSAAGTLPTKSSSLPDMPTPTGNNSQPEVDLFPDKNAGSAGSEGLSTTLPTSAPPASGKLTKPASKPVPALTPVVKGPGALVIPRENCGTFHTGWVDDAEADVNPCPAVCERGERISLQEYKSGDKKQYEGIYRCYFPKLIVNQKPAIARQIESGGVKGTNCGTFWTDSQEDANADVNPCPAHCERGELLDVRRGQSSDGSKASYQMNYRCYQAGTMNLASVSNPKPLAEDLSIKPASSMAASAEKMSSGSSGSTSISPVSGAPKGAQVAGTPTTASSQQALGDDMPQFNRTMEGRELTTNNLEGPGTVITSIGNMTPTSLTVRWKTVTGASAYRVLAKAVGLNHSVTMPDVTAGNNPPAELSSPVIGLAPGVEHTLLVSVIYPDGRIGLSNEQTLTTPVSENPRNFKALSAGPGSVSLVWDPVTNASHYIVEGSHLPRTETTETGIFINNIPPGQYTWSVMAVFPPGVYNVDNPSRASFEVTSYAAWAKTGKARYFLTLEGFRVNQQTSDDPLERDGKGDEVYFAAIVEKRLRETKRLESRTVRESKVYGDQNGFSSRYLSGRRSPLGGLQTGDVQNGSEGSHGLPWFIWEGELESSMDYLVVVFSVWEWDDNPNKLEFDHWKELIRYPGGGMEFRWGKHALSVDEPIRSNSTNAIDFGDPWQFWTLSSDRLIGLRKGPDTPHYQEQGVVLTREGIEALLEKSPEFGTITIRFQDAPELGSGYGGDYTVYLRVRREP